MTTLRDRKAAKQNSPTATLPLVLTIDASGVAGSQVAMRPQHPFVVLITGLETIAGFTAFAASLDVQERALPFGRRLADTDNLVDTVSALTAQVGDVVVARLDRMDSPEMRAALLAFPQHLAALLQDITQQLGEAPAPQAIYLSGMVDGEQVFATDAGLLLASDAPAPREKTRHTRAIARAAALAIASLATVVVLAGIGTAYIANRDLAADVAALVAQPEITDDPHLGTTTIADTDLANVVDVLTRLRDLQIAGHSDGFVQRVSRWTLLDQGEKLRAAAEGAYADALQRQFRSRLSLQIEQVIQARIGSPAELYEPLKIYLTLVGQAPRPDAELVVAWFRRDWEQVRYPGAANRPGRDALETHLRALLALPQPTDPALVDRGLIESAQRSLSRMDLASLADALIKGGGYSAELRDFSVASAGGPQAAAVFETANGRSVASLRIAGLYTASGFTGFFLPQLSKVAQQIIDDQWVMGAGGQQVGVEDQLRRLGPAILDRYGNEFSAAWNGLLEDLRLKPLSEDGPDYTTLAILSAETSPLVTLIEAIATETALTRDDPAADMDGLADGLATVGIVLPGGKSQSRAGSAFTTSSALPGANVAAQFGAFQRLTDGPAGRRPIDALMRNLREIQQSLVLAGAEGGNERAAANLQLQVLNLRSNASRLPRPLARMVQAAADDFEGDVATTTLAQLNRQFETDISGPCRALVEGAYPFSRTSDRDAPVGEFAQLFAPGGEFDRFFAQSLAPLVDMTGTAWKWRPDSRIARDLSPTTLAAFQRAADIRDAFFPESGGSLAVTLKPFSLHADADMALLDVDGQVVQAYQSGSSEATVSWPGGGMAERADLSLTPAIAGRESNLHVEGPWALMRLFDSASMTTADNAVQARFVVGGRDVTYNLQFNSKQNPFALPAMKDFRCPDKL